MHTFTNTYTPFHKPPTTIIRGILAVGLAWGCWLTSSVQSYRFLKVENHHAAFEYIFKKLYYLVIIRKITFLHILSFI